MDVTVTTLGGTSAVSSSDLFSYVAAPTATIAPAAGQANPATSTPILFTVSFNEPVSGLAAAGIKLTGSTASGAAVQSVTGSGTPVVLNGQSYYATWTVGVGGMTGSGNVIASVVAGAATDAVGNHSLVSASATVGFVSAPQVTIATTASQPTPINRGPLVFSVIFNQPVVGINPGSFSFAGSTAPGVGRMVGVYAVTVSTGAMSGSSQVYTVSVSGMTATGLVKLQPAGRDGPQLGGRRQHGLDPRQRTSFSTISISPPRPSPIPRPATWSSIRRSTAGAISTSATRPRRASA